MRTSAHPMRSKSSSVPMPILILVIFVPVKKFSQILAIRDTKKVIQFTCFPIHQNKSLGWGSSPLDLFFRRPCCITEARSTERCGWSRRLKETPSLKRFHGFQQTHGVHSDSEAALRHPINWHVEHKHDVLLADSLWYVIQITGVENTAGLYIITHIQ